MIVSNMNIPYAPTKAFEEKLKMLRYGKYTRENIYCRDPFVMRYGDKYYFYVTITTREPKGMMCYVSEDLENWSDPVVVYTPPENFHGSKQFFWAPECHYYNGYFYIFTSVFSSKYNHRTVSVYRADNPLGPFEDIANGAVAPTDWDTIDGTLYIDKQNRPWLVFVHEWTCMPDKNGGMAAARLSEDFTHLISEPIQLFLAKDPSWATRGVTDGPYLIRTNDGVLRMIWSNFSDNGYVVAKAHSDNGEIEGKWIQDGLLFQKDLREDFTMDGGHASVFQTKDGKFFMALHAPQSDIKEGDHEHLLLLPLGEDENGLKVL